MEFRILGPLEAEQGRALVPLGAEKQRALLAVLLLSANRTVSLKRLVDELWGEEPPEKAAKAIQTYVSRLRKVLPEDLLRTRPPGYVVALEPERLDLFRFERLAGQGRQALAEDDPHQAVILLREALALWRGPALAEFACEPFAASEGSRLEELRLSALEERIEADLALGRHADLVGELESLIAHHPFRERPRGQLMLALYRSGRQAEALAAYQDARRVLTEQLGIEPSRALQDLERDILRQNPSLELGGTTERAPMAARQPAGASARGVDVGAFVGREPELGRLRELLEGVLSGRGRLVMLAGEPGIGKTRTAAEFAAHAEERGVRVLWGRCYETEGAPPYWPWIEAMRSYVSGRDPHWFHAEARTTAAVVAELLPELRERLPGLERPPEVSDPKQARFRLLDTTATFLIGAARAEPFAIILDDLHAADAGSLLLLEFVAYRLGEAPLLIVATYRDVELTRGHPLSQTLAELTRERLFERLPLRGLAEEDVARYLEATLGVAPPEQLVGAVHGQTEGNPFFVTEIVRLLTQEGGLTADALITSRDWSVGVPEGVRDVIGRRLNRLPARCNELLRLASIFGREFSLEQLVRLSDDLSEDDLLRLLEEALAAHLVEEVPRAAGRYRFPHTLIQETLAAELSTTRRVRLHARIAEMLEGLYGPQAEAHAAELVHHFAEAETVLGTDKLIHYAQVAGERALAAHAYEEAAANFERALAAQEDRPMDERIAALLFGLARSELASRERYDLDEALARMRAAFDFYAKVGDIGRAVEVAAHPLPPIYVPTGAPELIGRAFAMVPPDSLEAGRLLTTLGWFRGMNERASARDAFERALLIARRHQDAALERRILLGDAHVDWWHLEWQDSLDKSVRAIELAQEADDRRTEMVARSTALRLLAIRGDLDAARANAETALGIALRLRERYWLVTTRVHMMWLALLEGDWTAARRLSDEALALQPGDARTLSNRALIEWETGNGAEADAYLQRLLESTRLSHSLFPFEDAAAAVFVPLLSGITGDDRQLELAEAKARAVLQSDAVPFLALYARVGLGLLATIRGNAALAKEQYEPLLRQRGTTLLFVGSLTTDRLLGLLSTAMRKLDAAQSHFEEALAFCAKAGYRPEFAWTACDFANALLERASPGDGERAARLRDEALAVARDLEMHMLQARLGTQAALA